MFRLLRHYAVASLVAVLVAAVLLTLYYRQASIQGIVDLTERSNLMLARSVLHPMKPALLEFLAATANHRPNNANPLPLPPELAESIKALMQDRTIARIKIYNRHGVVIFSSVPSQIGGDQSRNRGFVSAIRGEVASTLVYRDTFNRFDGHTAEDNLTQTYMPVQAGPADPIRGVFEIYTDVNHLVLLTERTEFIVMLGAVTILSALYAVLLLIVHRAGTLQQRTIRERTETLEVLSAQMLKSEESHKKKIAFDLHEGLAQTLAALKLQAETGRLNPPEKAAATASLESIIPRLQEAIQEVRSIATELRPPCLDDLGLLPTLSWLCRELEQRHPDLCIEQKISLQEGDVPAPLKIILYRIAASVLEGMAQHASPGRIRLALWLNHDTLTLLIADTSSAERSMAATALSDVNRQLRKGLARMEELTTLSGGVFRATQRAGGGMTLRAAWKG